MASRLRNRSRRAALFVAAAFALATGCHHHKGTIAGAPDTPPIGVPPPGSVPTELAMQNLPEYVIEPPDTLLINAVIRVPANEASKKDEAGNPLPPATGDTVRSLPIQPVYGDYPIRPDGTVFLGIYGSIPVSGYTLKQAAAAIRTALAKQLFEGEGVKEDRLLVVVDVTGYNSKSYYVITDGGGAGERIYRFPITGKETVLDGLANINGLPSEASKRNIWVARRTPNCNEPQQILPVDYVGATQHGITVTNYQIFPGDRIYVKAQRLVTIDTTLARALSPIERLFGVTLIGANAINNVAGRGQNSNGNR